MKISKIVLSLSVLAVTVPALAYGYNSILEQDRNNVRQQEALVRQQREVVEQQTRALRQQEHRLQELRERLRFDENQMHRNPPPPYYDGRSGYHN